MREQTKESLQEFREAYRKLRTGATKVVVVTVYFDDFNYDERPSLHLVLEFFSHMLEARKFLPNEGNIPANIEQARNEGFWSDERRKVASFVLNDCTPSEIGQLIRFFVQGSIVLMRTNAL